MSRILVAVSSPWAAEKSVDPVTDLAKRLSAEVLVIHVSRPSGGQMRGVTVQTLLMFSEDIARAILNVAVEREVTLIALGLTGKNIFARLLAGNVPVELIKNTKIPVLLL